MNLAACEALGTKIVMEEDLANVGPEGRVLLLMRHANSPWGGRGVRDFERELSSRGHMDSARVGRWLANSGRVPDHVVCSPARRARETVADVLKELGSPLSDVRWAEGIYEASPSDLIDVLSQTPERAHCVLMVGHNPGMEMLAGLFARGSGFAAGVQPSFSTASVAHLTFEGDWDSVHEAGCELVTMMRPKDLPLDG